ncbi:glycoside hydrolase superfamily [Lipomyces arxii]|uniref:glycoside hydrolase superfamily n=1 Tax=Lipomyces arxii TaxID=56418 RepID=UPI0034CEECFD
MSTGLTQIVQWDTNSLYIRNKPVYIIGGEFHYWRLPVQELYFDVFQKLRATGHNTVSIYFHWGYHSLNESNSVYLGVGRDINAILQAAKRAGLYIIARPGPYIHAETTGGGIPGWLLNRKDVQIRTNETQYTKAWNKYFADILPFIIRNQIDRGGNVIALQIENEYMDSDLFPSAREYMTSLASMARNMGIVVPIFHNDLNMFKSFTPQEYPSIVDLYGLDSYPRGFDCKDPTSNFNIVTNYREYLHNVSSRVPNFVPEFQGGAFDGWGGPGNEMCTELTNSQYVNVFYKNNVVQKFTMMSYYMGFGGTNWGGFASPGVYTSYDYGAAISETRIIRDKANEAKLLWTFLHASPSLLKSRFISDSDKYAYTDNHDVFVSEMRDAGCLSGYYVVRSRNTNSRDGKAYRLKIRTIADGEIQIPYKGSLTLPPRESRILVTDYSAGPLQLGYSTLEVFTWTIVDEKPVVAMYGDFGDLHELSITQHGNIPHKIYNIRGETLIQNTNVKTVVTPTNGLRITLLLDGESRAVVTSHDYTLVLMNRPEIYKVWVPSLFSDEDPNTPIERQIIVIGPYLVRNVTIEEYGATLNINGDIDMEENGSWDVEVFADSRYKTIRWNGVEAASYLTKFGSRTFTVPTPSNNLAAVEIPNLSEATWRAIDSLPEIRPEYDDSKWVVANKNESANIWHPPKTIPVLYPGEYGFHVGNVIYRGRFSAKGVDGVELEVCGGSAFGFTAWINGRYLTSFRGNATYACIARNVKFSKDYLTDVFDNVLVILADRMGYELDNGVTERDMHSAHYPRGIRSIELVPTVAAVNDKLEFSSWTIQGNAGGEDFDDLLRAPYNEDGVYAQRIGAHLPAFDDSKWKLASPITKQLPGVRLWSAAPGAGVQFYRTTVKIEVADMLDVPLGILLKALPESGVRAELFVNGWQFGKYVSDVGPQDEFPIPPGILNLQGDNYIGVQVWAVDDSATAGLDKIEFVQYGRYASAMGPIGHGNYMGWPAKREKYVTDLN